MSAAISKRDRPDLLAQPYNHRPFYLPSTEGTRWTISISLCARALIWLFPWQWRAYPGLKRGSLGLAGHSVVWQSIHSWRTGHRTLPAWYADILAETIKTRSQAGMELVAELESYSALKKATPRPIYGACAVWADGKDRRGAKRKVR